MSPFDLKVGGLYRWNRGGATMIFLLLSYSDSVERFYSWTVMALNDRFNKPGVVEHWNFSPHATFEELHE